MFWLVLKMAFLTLSSGQQGTPGSSEDETLRDSRAGLIIQKLLGLNAEHPEHDLKNTCALLKQILITDSVLIFDSLLHKEENNWDYGMF